MAKQKRFCPVGRFLAKINIVESGCWEWQGAISVYGYALFNPTHEFIVRAHRYSYEYFKNKIPDGLQVDHLCRNRKCVNPRHLDAVSNKENIMRGEGICAKNVLKTLCPQGHPYSYFYNGHRACRICRQEALNRFRNKKGVKI